MTINIGGGELKELKPRILVMGVGGAGGNAINAMIEDGMRGVEFVAVNTDAQDLKANKADAKIQIGMNLTKGLGAGAKHDIGQAAADESLNEIVTYLQGANMVFITAGMGGGTGTGASHIIARAAKELNILTVGVITLPFSYEGPKRMRRAMEGWGHLRRHLDASIVVPNQNLFKIANESTTFEKSFSLSNDVLKHGVRSVTDLMVRPGLINLDFADVETVMSSMGKAMMGTGEAEGENRALAATELALNNPLIDDYSLKGARGLLVNITGGEDIKLFEVDQAVNKIRSEVDPEAELIFGAIKDENLNGKMRVSIVATALDGESPESKSVVNMVHRIHNRNSGYSESHLSNTNNIPQSPSVDSIQGATALKLDNEFQTSPEIQTNQNILTTTEQELKNETNIDPGISLENAAYFENNLNNDQTHNDEAAEEVVIDEISVFEEKPNSIPEANSPQDNDVPQLFSDEVNSLTSSEDNIDENIKNEEEEFEIPAFLRKQKF